MTVWHPWNIRRDEREARNGHRAAVIWFTGFSGAGKSTIAQALERRLYAAGAQTMLLDGDQVRHGLCSDLAFSAEDRAENIRRVAHVAHLFFEHGNVVLCAFISPFAEDRAYARSLVPEGHFVEVFVDTALDECRRRDPKGLYEKADAGKIPHFTGISSPYELPVNPEIHLETTALSIDESIGRIVDYLAKAGLKE